MRRLFTTLLLGMTLLSAGVLSATLGSSPARAASCGEDLDEDSYVDRDCQTGEEIDCNDSDDSIHPDAEEVAYDGIDQDCDGRDLCDLDGDGYSSTACSSVDADGNTVTGTDCDDTNANIHPFAVEVADDGVDDDCSGSDLSRDCDLDEDGFDARACGGQDCDDLDPEINPGIAEIEDDGLDQDCDGLDYCVSVAWVQGGLGCSVGPDPSAIALAAGLVALALSRRGRAPNQRASTSR